MKLIFCPNCQDLFKLKTGKIKYCNCRNSWGMYKEDKLNAEIYGLAIPVGIANDSFVDALKDRPESGLGKRFEAFIIPFECETIKSDNFDPRKTKKSRKEKT